MVRSNSSVGAFCTSIASSLLLVACLGFLATGGAAFESPRARDEVS